MKIDQGMLNNFIKKRLPLPVYLTSSIFYRSLRAFILFIILPGYPFSEKLFWRCWIPKIWEQISLKENWEIIFPKELLEYINEFKRIKKERLVLLEVGSGPVSTLALAVEKNLCEIIAIDLFAEHYNRFMMRKRYNYPIKPLKGKGEKLQDLFKENYFDMVYSSNALDHVSSPQKTFLGMYGIVKEGGIIFIEGYVNEGSREHWNGLHQFDLYPHEGHLLCRNKRGKIINLTDGLALRCEIEKIVPASERSYNILFNKNLNSDWFVVSYRKNTT